jgi:hypothetical protein
LKAGDKAKSAQYYPQLLDICRKAAPMVGPSCKPPARE